MVGEIHIWYTKRKRKPTVEDIVQLVKDNDVELYGVPLELFEKLMGQFKNYSLEIYQDRDDEAPLSVDVYWLNHETLTNGLTSIYYIFISTKQVREPFAYAVLRR